jgi:hypothetical protein
MDDQNNWNAPSVPGKLTPMPKPVNPGRLRHGLRQDLAKPRRTQQVKAVPIEDDFELQLRVTPQDLKKPEDNHPPIAVIKPVPQKPSKPSKPTYIPTRGQSLHGPTFTQAFVIFIRRKFNKPNRTRTGEPSYRGKTNYAKISRILGALALGLVCAGLIISFIWYNTNQNAYAVYLGDELIGNIARAQDIDAVSLQSQAVKRLEASLGASVRVDENVSLKPVHSAPRDILPDADVLDSIIRNRAFTYKLEAAAIFVEGREIAVLKTEAEVEAVARQLQNPYINGSFDDYISVTFLEDWLVVPKLVDQDELDTAEAALIQLDKKTRVMEDYSIQDGDTLGAIARRNNTTVDKICIDNPGYTSTTILRPGRIIRLETTRPYLSVKTVEEILRREAIPMPVKNVDNPGEYKTYTKVLQEGADGEREITVRITRVNGVQTGAEEEISARVTREPVERLIEVGTSETAPQPRTNTAG